jgi:hypothetical protein
LADTISKPREMLIYSFFARQAQRNSLILLNAKICKVN